MKKFQGWFVQFCSILAFVLVFCGCGGASYEIIASSSGFPTSAQMERDRVILAIPKDLREKLEAVVRESNASAELGGNRQFFAQMPNPKVLLQKKLLETVLGWAGQKPPDERLNEQTQRMQQPTNELTIDDPRVQYGAGVASGAAIGTVPFGPFAADVAIELKVLPKGTYYARVGRCAGELVSGVIQMVVGCSGMATGIGLTGTGGGAPAGIVVISGSFAVALNGSVTAGHALDEAQRLWNEGAPPEAPAPAPQEQLLQPKTKPQTAPPVHAAPAAKPTAPAPQTAAPAPKPKQAPTQAGADVKPKAKDSPTTAKTNPSQPSTTSVTNGHHPWPKYLGGPAKQDLANLSESLHKSYHSGLDKILPRQRGTAYYENLNAQAKQQLIRDLAAYTKAFDTKHGTRLYDSMLRNGFPATP